MPTVAEYVRSDGANPYRKRFDGLDAQAAAKVAVAVARLETDNTSSLKWLGAIGEYRIDWGPGYRIYLTRDGNALIVLLGSGTKKGQQHDIARAQALAAEYKARKAPARPKHKR
jgi:putative addiction module killer protein